ncbi:hypothetical protein Pr1d_35810 [Bythopirellula goksoeyrii]|uniref:Uncharacterized protein n=1 Tax=Bythopirellula goksoeyrii TaxID=1400387 RepID=A0A5B9QEG3_9BACT|nr:hypothetical protein Pr1d_35810 [Bythopirellula goksoeyrii]
MYGELVCATQYRFHVHEDHNQVERKVMSNTQKKMIGIEDSFFSAFISILILIDSRLTIYANSKMTSGLLFGVFIGVVSRH